MLRSAYILPPYVWRSWLHALHPEVLARGPSSGLLRVISAWSHLYSNINFNLELLSAHDLLLICLILGHPFYARSLRSAPETNSWQHEEVVMCLTNSSRY